jgi:mono/diheme cytochrome c family protein
MSAKITLSLIVTALALVTFALGCAGPQPLPLAPTPIPTLIPATLPPEPTLAPLPTSTGPSGATIFANNCSTCHNLTAEPRVGPGLAGLFERTQLPNGGPVTDANLAEWIHTGGGGMPGFPLSDADTAALIAYLKEATGAAPAATTAPAATSAPPQTTAPAQVAADAFNAKCSACHSLTAERKVGPGLQGLFSLPALPNGQPVTDANLRDWMRNGGGAMPPIALSDAEVAAIIAYLRQELGSAAPVVTTPAGSTGEAVFVARCSSCHELTTERKVGPGLQGMFTRITTLPNGEPFDEKELRDFIRKGGGAMPEVKLEDDEYDALIAYLREATR